jgi:hypothetical protein
MLAALRRELSGSFAAADESGQLLDAALAVSFRTLEPVRPPRRSFRPGSARPPAQWICGRWVTQITCRFRRWRPFLAHRLRHSGGNAGTTSSKIIEGTPPESAEMALNAIMMRESSPPDAMALRA